MAIKLFNKATQDQKVSIQPNETIKYAYQEPAEFLNKFEHSYAKLK